jgi:hypothetical protein
MMPITGMRFMQRRANIMSRAFGSTRPNQGAFKNCFFTTLFLIMIVQSNLMFVLWVVALVDMLRQLRPHSWG